MKKVFLPHVPSRYDPIEKKRVSSVDISKAADYGELVLMNGTETTALPENIPGMIRNIRDKISLLEKDDYVLAIGDPVLIAAAISYAADAHGSVKVLRWSKFDRGYTLLEVVL